MEWLHDTNPNGHPSMAIPDPRTLFRLLNPSANFKIVGHRVTDGVRLTELRATMAPTAVRAELAAWRGARSARRAPHRVG